MSPSKSYMVPKVYNYSEFFEIVNKIEVPPYQRPYTWKRKNVEDFWNDIFDCLEYKKNLDEYVIDSKHDEHFLGTIFIKKMPGLDSHIELIDGQQRVTTTFLLFRALKSKLSEILKKESINIEDDEVAFIKKAFTRYLTDSTNSFSKLSLGLVDGDFLDKLLEYEDSQDKEVNEELGIKDESEEDPEEDEDRLDHSIKSPDTNTILSKNYRFLKDLIDQEIRVLTEPEKSGDNLIIKEEFTAFTKLFHGIELVMNDVFYVVVNTLDKDSSEGGTFRMFENINTRGKQLDQIDKIKNKFFAFAYDDFSSKNEKHKYEKLKSNWSTIVQKLDNRAEAFVRYNLIVTINRHIDENKLYDEILKFIENQMEGTRYRRGDIVYSFVQNLNENINTFKFLDKPSFYPLAKLSSNHKKRHKEHVFQNISYANQYELLIPVLFRSLIEFNNDNLSIEDLHEITSTCSSFFISLKLAGRSPKDYFKSIVQLITKYFKERDLTKKTFSDYILEKDTLPYLDIKLLFENKNNFIKRLSQFTDYKTNIILIHKLESHLSINTQESIEVGKYQVEHIWPVKGRGEWQAKKDEALDHRDELTFKMSLNRIGNLLIIEERINKVCSDKAYELKVAEYKNSSRATVSDFLNWCKNNNVEDFDFITLENRSIYLAELIFEKEILTKAKKLTEVK
jgi:uncharacterized protein with ParB-like and HNH nuclease domain